MSVMLLLFTDRKGFRTKKRAPGTYLYVPMREEKGVRTGGGGKDAGVGQGEVVVVGVVNELRSKRTHKFGWWEVRVRNEARQRSPTATKPLQV